MSYRLPDHLPEVREPSVLLFDVAKPGDIIVDNGTITRINVPCAYSRRMSRNDLMFWDHMGWPSHGRADRSDYAPFFQIRPIDLSEEGYVSTTVVLGSEIPGFSMYASLDCNMVLLTVSAICPDANTEDLEVPFAVYVTGSNDEVGQLSDLVIKGIVHIRAGYVSGYSPEPGPSPTPSTYTISYNANGGTGTMAGQTVMQGQSVTLRTNQFTREDYVFFSWNTAANGSGLTFTDGQTFTPTRSYALFAQWVSSEPTPEPEIYVISYDANGGSGSMASQEVEEGSSVTLRSNTFTRNGYLFSSWNTEADGSGISFTNGQTFTPTSGYTLYAQWEEAEPEPTYYTITYNANGGRGTMASQTVLAGRPIIISRNQFVYLGKDFYEWYTNPYGYMGTSFYEGQPVYPNQNLTLYAIWR